MGSSKSRSIHPIPTPEFELDRILNEHIDDLTKSNRFINAFIRHFPLVSQTRILVQVANSHVISPILSKLISEGLYDHYRRTELAKTVNWLPHKWIPYCMLHKSNFDPFYSGYQKYHTDGDIWHSFSTCQYKFSSTDVDFIIDQIDTIDFEMINSYQLFIQRLTIAVFQSNNQDLYQQIKLLIVVLENNRIYEMLAHDVFLTTALNRCTEEMLYFSDNKHRVFIETIIKYASKHVKRRLLAFVMLKNFTLQYSEPMSMQLIYCYGGLKTVVQFNAILFKYLLNKYDWMMITFELASYIKFKDVRREQIMIVNSDYLALMRHHEMFDILPIVARYSEDRLLELMNVLPEDVKMKLLETRTFITPELQLAKLTHMYCQYGIIVPFVGNITAIEI